MRSLVVRSLLTYTVYSSQGLVVNSHRTIPCAQIGVQVARAAAIAPQRVNAKRVPVGSRDARTRLRSDQWRELLVWLGGDGIGAGGPILRNEIHAPEMGRWGKKFNADALAFVHGFAEIDHAAFLLFLGERVGERNERIHGDFLIEIDQAAVGVDHDGLARGAKLPSADVFSRGHYAHAHENPSAAPVGRSEGCAHVLPMLRQAAAGVNNARAAAFLPETCPRDQCGVRASSLAVRPLRTLAADMLWLRLLAWDEEHFQITAEMIEAVGGDCGSVLGFGEYERALDHGLGV